MTNREKLHQLVDELSDAEAEAALALVRGLDTEVELGPADGMPVECAVSLDNMRTVPRALLTESITTLDSMKMTAICRALEHATGCWKAR